MPSSPTPKLTYGDSYSIGQLADQWGRSPDFVRGLMSRDLLHTDERGLITNDELANFYSEHGTELD